MTILDYSKNKMDDLWFKVKTKAGYCSSSASLKDAKDYISKADVYIKIAYGTERFIIRNQEVSNKLKSASDAIGPVKKYVNKVDKICGDVSAIGRMGDAIAVLNGWVAHPATRTDDEAAAAFDMLFGAAGRFATRLPPPLNAYAQILEAISISQFFSGMRIKLDPARRQGGGAQMREILETIDAQGRGG